MSDELQGKIAAVTGAASGIGLECARTFLRSGATVFLVDRAGEKLNQLCSELGDKAIPMVIDLTNPSSVAGHDAENPGNCRRARHLPRQRRRLYRRRGGVRRSGCVGPHVEPERQRRVPLDPCRTAAHDLKKRAATSSSPVRWRGLFRWCGEPILHRIQTRRSGLRAHRSAPDLQAWRPHRRRRPGPRGYGACWTTGPRPKWKRRVASGSLMEPKEVAEAVLFMLTRPRSVTIRDLVIVPLNLDL